jgi:hypothetical protein
MGDGLPEDNIIGGNFRNPLIHFIYFLLDELSLLESGIGLDTQEARLLPEPLVFGVDPAGEAGEALQLLRNVAEEVLRLAVPVVAQLVGDAQLVRQQPHRLPAFAMVLLYLLAA